MEGCHPEILDALIQTNMESTPGYGTDAYTKEAKKEILEACGIPNGEVYFLVGGTQTNAVVIDAVLPSYMGALCAKSGHINVHEAGAIEFTRHKVLPIDGQDGKIQASQIEAYMKNFRADLNFDHTVFPGMVYLSQPTEYGTLYSKEELVAIRKVCDAYDLVLYIDGARLAYALQSPSNDVSLKDLGELCDVFYIGGTKCGSLFGEAVVFRKNNFVPNFFTIIKQHGALLSKGRLLGIQFHTFFKDGLYERVGASAITYAGMIKAKLKECGYEVLMDSPTNQIFFVASHKQMVFFEEYTEFGYMEEYDENSSIIRFCTSWATSKEATEALLQIIEKSVEM